MQCPRLVWTTFIPRVRTYASRMEWTGALPYSIQLALCMPVCANQAKPSIESISSFVLSSGRQEEKQRIWGIHALPCRACDFSNICRPHTHFRDEKKINRRAEIHQINHYPKNPIPRLLSQMLPMRRIPRRDFSIHPSIHFCLSQRKKAENANAISHVKQMRKQPCARTIFYVEAPDEVVCRTSDEYY